MSNLNAITILALLSWPFVAVWLYTTWPIGRATLWTILGADMLLPVGAHIKFSMIPEFDKSSICNLAALFGCVVICGESIRFASRFGLVELSIVMVLVCPFITNELNGDQITVGGAVLPGLGAYDAGSLVISQAITLIPFFLGRRFLCNRTDTEEILRGLIIAGLIYSLPALFEIRFSPQLHTWIYGYFPHEFLQQMRDGGFRPVVFMGHGLLVSLFFCISAVAAAAFWRTNTQVTRRVHLSTSGITVYLSILLLLCKTASSSIYGAVLVLLVCLTRPKLQSRIAVLLVSVALLYPGLRIADLVPTSSLLDLMKSISIEREGSLAVRFFNENQLLERASQRWLFGWGRYGRSWIYDESGRETSVPDGQWIITLGGYGVVGFLAEFGLLALPIFSTARALRFAESPKEKAFLSALALILAINVFDLLPNSSLRPWTWLIAGALLGRAETLRLGAQLPRKLGALLPKKRVAPMKQRAAYRSHVIR